jgi:hypothetical protein
MVGGRSDPGTGSHDAGYWASNRNAHANPKPRWAIRTDPIADADNLALAVHLRDTRVGAIEQCVRGRPQAGAPRTSHAFGSEEGPDLPAWCQTARLPVRNELRNMQMRWRATRSAQIFATR